MSVLAGYWLATYPIGYILRIVDQTSVDIRLYIHLRVSDGVEEEEEEEIGNHSMCTTFVSSRFIRV